MNVIAVVDGNSVVVDPDVSPTDLTDSELSLNRRLVEGWAVGATLGRPDRELLFGVLNALVAESDARGLRA